MSKILGLDYGEKRIGVAISDKTKTFAFGKGIILNTGLKKSLEEIQQIIKENKITEIVLGLPITLNGKYSSQTNTVKRFGDRLESMSGIKVSYLDERLTSEETKKIIQNIKKKKSRTKVLKDEIEAAIILKTFLHQKCNKKDIDKF